MAPSSWIWVSLQLVGSAHSSAFPESATLLQSRKIQATMGSDQSSQLESTRSKELSFVESLAHTIATTNTSIDDAAEKALTAIKDTLQTSVTGIQSAHTSDVTILNNEKQVHDNCGTTFQSSKDADAILKSELDAKELSHSTCRTKLGKEDADKTQKCNALDDFVAGINPPNCAKPDGKLTNYFQTIETFVDTNKDSYATKLSDCETATTLGENTEEDCDTKQGAFETAGCTLEVEVYSTCSTYKICESAARTDFVGSCTSATTSATQRQVEYRSIKKIECYIGKILNSAALTLDDLQECVDLNPDVSDLVITCPTLSDAQECDFSSVQNVPCNAGWTSKYDGMIGLDQCSACPALASHLLALKPSTTMGGLCIGAKGNTPATINFDNEMCLDSVHFKWVSGGVHCDGQAETAFGCTYSGQNEGIVFTKANSRTIEFPVISNTKHFAPASPQWLYDMGWYQIAGINIHSKEMTLEIKDDVTVKVSGAYKMWFVEDRADSSEGDNGGTVCHDVTFKSRPCP